MLSAGHATSSGCATTSASSTTAPQTHDVAVGGGRRPTACVYVPALLGLGTPAWDYGARGTLLGLTRGTTAAHVVRAVLEGVAHRGADLVEAAEADTGLTIETLRVDGGMSANPTFIQALADATGRPVEVSPVVEATTLGAAFLAGLADGRVGRRSTTPTARGSPAAVVEPGAAARPRRRGRRAVERGRRLDPRAVGPRLLSCHGRPLELLGRARPGRLDGRTPDRSKGRLGGEPIPTPGARRRARRHDAGPRRLAHRADRDRRRPRPPERPTDADIELLAAPSRLELAARDLYQAAHRRRRRRRVRCADDAARATTRPTPTSSPGSSAGPRRRPRTTPLRRVRGRLRHVATSPRSPHAGYDLESTLVATHTELLGQLEGIDGAALIASILIVEARQLRRARRPRRPAATTSTPCSSTTPRPSPSADRRLS